MNSQNSAPPVWNLGYLAAFILSLVVMARYPTCMMSESLVHGLHGYCVGLTRPDIPKGLKMIVHLVDLAAGEKGDPGHLQPHEAGKQGQLGSEKN